MGSACLGNDVEECENEKHKKKRRVLMKRVVESFSMGFNVSMQ